MNSDIALWLVQDGITNGAIYALLALALLLVFAVTRVIFVPQGEFISYAALSLALLQAGRLPGTVFVLVIGGLTAAAFDSALAIRDKGWPRLPRGFSVYVVLPVLLGAITSWAVAPELRLLLPV